jgi:hypothetical protein
MPRKFIGRVFARSSTGKGGPPGEKAILELNPERRERILELTGWRSLEAGTLNLAVDDTVLDLLRQSEPDMTEDASTILYPEPWKHIPAIRKAYLYYKATACAPLSSAEVLVRRAQIPVPGRVELFAAQNIRTTLKVSDGDLLQVELDDPAELLARMRNEWEEERRFHSNEGKEERERWVVTEFLKIRGIQFGPEEIVSAEQAHSTDVQFRAAEFQVKEIASPDERRQRDIKEIHARVSGAKQLRDLIGPSAVYDTPPVVAGDVLVYNTVAELSKDPRYFPSKNKTDLLLYVTHSRASLPSVWTLDWSQFSQLGWRSISCLIKDQAHVIFAAEAAPDFLRSA